MNADLSNGRTKYRAGRLLVDISPLRESRPYRLLFAARAASLLVYAIESVAVSWQVFVLTGSSLQVAAVGFCLAASMAGGLLIGGPLADRFDRRLLMFWMRSVYLGAVGLLLANATLPSPSLCAIYLAAIASGLAGGVSAPALMAATPSLVGRERLPAAMALVAMVAPIGAILGPSLAGMLIAGPGLVFCYVIVLAGAGLTPILLWLLPPLAPPRDVSLQGFFAFAEVWRFLHATPLITGLLLIDMAALLFAMPQVLIPEIATEIFAGGPRTAGLLYTVTAVGALVAGLSSGWIIHAARPGIALVVMILLWGTAILGAGLSGGFTAVALYFGLAGFAGASAEILRGALLQLHTPDDLRGRISSIWLMQSTLGPALGGMQMGLVPRHFSPALALVFGGAACVVCAGAASFALPAIRSARFNRGTVPATVSVEMKQGR